MEDLLQQEAELEAQIEEYKSQLKAVQNASAGGDGEGLAQLIADLEQLIGLTEENLVEVKKHKLLLMLGQTPATAVEAAPTDADGGDPLPCDPPEGTGSVHTSTEEEDKIIGMKCRAPLKESWGGESHHNAVIIYREQSPLQGGGHDIEPPDPEVCVLFTQPLYPAMKPCSFFLNGTCKFSEQECKYSHGHVVALSRLHPYVEPDYSLAHVGGRCLAKHEEDDMWYHAIISSVGTECVVHFPSLSITSTVAPEDMVPLESCDGSGSEGNHGDDDDDDEEEVVVEWKPCSHALGQWERHTTGIGSRLLAKMGYVVGHGLGKEGQGRVEPVEIVVLPAGKSLDVCMELREHKKVKTVDGLEKKKKKRSSAVADKKPTDMFEFLNTTVFSGRTSIAGPVQETRPVHTGNLNVKLFKVQEDIKATKKRKNHLIESLQRHEKRKDKKLAEQVKEKIKSLESQLEQLHRQENSVEKSISTKSERKKLAIF